MLNLNVTEFLTDSIKCPFFKGSYNSEEYEDNIAKKYDLSDIAERGKYYHNYIANSIDKNIKLIYQNTPINNDAEETIKWLKEEIGTNGMKAEQSIIKSIISDKGDIWTITGKPDAFVIKNDTLTVIDFKYTDKENENYKKQTIIYSGMLAEQFDVLDKFIIFIKYKSFIKKMELNREVLMTIYQNYISEMLNYINSAKRKACLKCDKCQNERCKEHAMALATSIIKYANKTDAEDFSDEEIAAITYAVASIEKLKEKGRSVIPQKKETQFQSTKEAVKLYKDKCKALEISPVIDVKESVKADVFKATMGEETFQMFCTKPKTKPLTEISKPYCEWE